MNDDSRLHVDPAVISGGVKATLDCVDEMSGTIRSVASAHEDLLAVWTGPASRDVEGTWSELEPAFRRLSNGSATTHSRFRPRQTDS